MLQVRRKTTNPLARTYLLKAKKEGIQLSWNQFERMLPQDGFGLLGLTCFECLQGPCRINPFRSEESATICGLTRDDLVFNGLFCQVSKNNELVDTTKVLLERFFSRISRAEVNRETLQTMAAKWRVTGEPESGSGWLARAWELITPSKPFADDLIEHSSERLSSLLTAANNQVALMAFNADLLELLNEKVGVQKREVGLGALRLDCVNICLEGVSPAVLDLAEEVATELSEEANRVGASNNYNLLLVGDFSSYHKYAAVCNRGAAEFALLTGMVDLYLVGSGNMSRGRNFAGQYHTVLAECTADCSKEALRKLFQQAAKVSQERDLNTVEASVALEQVNVGYVFAAAPIQEAIAKEIINGLCIIAGGSNVRVTAEEAAVKIVEATSSQDILCLTYGNAAVTLGQYGYLAFGEQSGSDLKACALALEAKPVAYCLGGELAATVAVELVREISEFKVVVVFPEMMDASDLQAALAFAAAGATVLTGSKLPVDGSETLCHELGNKIQYCEPQKLAGKVLEILVGDQALI